MAGGLKLQGTDATEFQKQTPDIAFKDVVWEVSDIKTLRRVEGTPHEDRLDRPGKHLAIRATGTCN